MRERSCTAFLRIDAGCLQASLPAEFGIAPQPMRSMRLGRDACDSNVRFDVLGVDIAPPTEYAPVNILRRKSVRGA